MLKAKLETLKKNLDHVGRETLKTKYNAAYTKLLEEITALSREKLFETVLIWDLSCVKEESIPLFQKLFDEQYKHLTKYLLNGDYTGYENALKEFSIVYAKLWCHNVMKKNENLDYKIYNPKSLEKIMIEKQAPEENNVLQEEPLEKTA